MGKGGGGAKGGSKGGGAKGGAKGAAKGGDTGKEKSVIFVHCFFRGCHVSLCSGFLEGVLFVQ